MQITYDQGIDARTIEIGDAEIECLKNYAIGVLLKMRETDKEFSDCWEACGIDFDGIQPDFYWGSKDDVIPEDYAIFVSLPNA